MIFGKKTKKKVIPVVLALNDNYTIPTTVCIYSILEKTKSFIHFFLLADGVTSEHKKQIKKAMERFENCKLSFVDMKRYDLQRFPNLFHFSTSAYSRFFIPEICKKYDKVIYTDADCIFMGDIAKYYAIDLGNYGIAATVEEIGKEHEGIFNHRLRKKTFSIDESHLYFQSANIIINCAYWRKYDITAKLVEKAIQYHDKLVAADLDAFNMVFANNYKKLHFKYGVTVHTHSKTEGNQEMIEGFQNPFIIHYAGAAKPWNTRFILFYQEFQDVLAKVMAELNKKTNQTKYKLFGVIPLLSIEDK
ncbi:MAG: glycosyltransferase family 8 protein [Alphaproteobacteria bacterium]|nr:glycosyltransferase family 8 protein [Alphaproteobacteria bacterium]